MYQRMKDLPLELMPRERMIQLGPEALSNQELLAVLLRTGSKGENVLDLAERLLGDYNGIAGLARMTVHEAKDIYGIGPAKATALTAALELGKRLAATGTGQRPIVNSPQDVARLMMEEMRYLDREHFKVITLTTKNHVLGIGQISVGLLNSSLVHPRECFKEAIRRNSNAIILVHNHPSGDPAPSREDVEVTRRMAQAGEILGIEVLDHVIIGDNRYISLKERGIL